MDFQGGGTSATGANAATQSGRSTTKTPRICCTSTSISAHDVGTHGASLRGSSLSARRLYDYGAKDQGVRYLHRPLCVNQKGITTYCGSGEDIATSTESRETPSTGLIKIYKDVALRHEPTGVKRTHHDGLSSRWSERSSPQMN